MTGQLLFSVNPMMKLLIQEKYFGNMHYGWCAEQWDSKSLSP